MLGRHGLLAAGCGRQVAIAVERVCLLRHVPREAHTLSRRCRPEPNSHIANSLDTQTGLHYKVLMTDHTESTHHLGPTDHDLDDAPPSADEALALIREQQSALERDQVSGIPWILGVWGVAWTVGFLALWSGYDGGNPWLQIPLPIASVIFAALLVGAAIVSAALAMRLNRGVRGPSNFSGAVYGISWPIVAFAAYLIGVGLAVNGMDRELQSLFFPAIFALVAGCMYAMGAAIWRSVDQLVLGMILVVAGTAAPFFGAPTNNLVMAVVGGGALLISGLVMHLNLRRARR